jgi:hypothetical protein
VEDNIKIDFKGIVWEGVDWIYLGQGQVAALVSTVMNPQVP